MKKKKKKPQFPIVSEPFKLYRVSDEDFDGTLTVESVAVYRITNQYWLFNGSSPLAFGCRSRIERPPEGATPEYYREQGIFFSALEAIDAYIEDRRASINTDEANIHKAERLRDRLCHPQRETR